VDNVEFLTEARKRLKILSDADQENKDNFVEDMKFAFNIEEGHWNTEDINERDEEGRPHLTMNKLSKYVAIVVNSIKTQPVLDEIIPVDDQGDIAIARVYNDLIEHIEYQSEAENVYSQSAEHAIAGGFGCWRILTQYTDDGFDQEIILKSIDNPLMVYLDPRRKFAFIREVMSIRDFDEQYPDADRSDFESDAGGDVWELWYEGDKISVAEYFVKEPYTRKIVLAEAEDGRRAIIEETSENKEALKAFRIIKERKIQSHKVMWYKITGTEILEKKEWPGSEIPIIEVVGHEVKLEGKSHKMSLIKDAKDPMRMYDYWITSMTEKIALAPKAPYMVTQQQISGFEEFWNNANTKNLPYLPYNPSSQGPPQRTPATPIDPGAMALLQLANNDIKDVLGMYESSMGMPSNERSGKAINARAARSDLQTYTFQDNLKKARRKTKKMLIELIPKIYDNQRVVRLRNKSEQDGQGAFLQLNWPTMTEGVLMNDLSVGKYDIRTKSEMTPSRRQQTLDTLSQFMQYAKDFAGPILAEAVKYVDAPGGEELSNTIKAMMQQGAQNGLQKPTT